MMLLVAVTYALHLVSFPRGWSTPGPYDSRGAMSRPIDATMGANGSVAVILADRSRFSTPRQEFRNPAQRILIVRSDGTTTVLRSPVTLALPGFPHAAECLNDARNCAFFSNVALGRDGTPFATFKYRFNGAYSGMREVALVWNGAWHVVSQRNALRGIARPVDPDNVSIGAADTPWDYAFVGNYSDLSPMEDLVVAARDPQWMADVSGVTFAWGSVGLGIGDATAIAGRYVAGFDAGLKLVEAPSSRAVALRWECVQSVAAMRPCARVALGPGIAYGVDSRGDAVGDDEAGLPDIARRTPLYTLGQPVLWRDRAMLALSSEYGAAYAIAEDGTIAGTMRPAREDWGYEGFFADARDGAPHARPIDPLVANLGGLHVLAAFGASGNGRILALVIRKNDWRGERKLGVLVPVR
jgi:hypothetical protein